MSSQISFIDKQGLNTALDTLRTLCLTKAEGAQICQLISALADAMDFPAYSLTIPATGWQADTLGDFSVYIDVAAEVTAEDSAEVSLSVDGLKQGTDCGLCPLVETLDGYLRFRAFQAPAAAITGEYRVLRGVQDEAEGGAT